MLKDNLIHRGLKPNNVLISLDKLDNIIIKLSHYGLSNELSNTITFTGTPLIMAPEILKGEDELKKLIYEV